MTPPKTKAVGVSSTERRVHPTSTAPQAKGWGEERENIYKILKRNDATNSASWWNIASEVVDEWLPSLLHSNREEVIREIENILENFWPEGTTHQSICKWCGEAFHRGCNCETTLEILISKLQGEQK